MSDILFCIPCKYTENNSYIFNCVSNLRKHHPNDDILVIDSFSNDDSYLKLLKEKYEILEDSFKNGSFIDGVIWHAYKKYSRKKYCFIHDNLIINRNINTDISVDFSTYGYFRSCFKPYSKELVDRGIIGLEDPIKALDWANENLKKLKIEPIEYFDGILGCMFNTDRSVLDRIYALGWSEVFLPKNKIEACQMERMWGLIIAILGYDIKKNCIIGDYLNKSLWEVINGVRHMKNNGVEKIFGGRQ